MSTLVVGKKKKEKAFLLSCLTFLSAGGSPFMMLRIWAFRPFSALNGENDCHHLLLKKSPPMEKKHLLLGQEGGGHAVLKSLFQVRDVR